MIRSQQLVDEFGTDPTTGTVTDENKGKLITRADVPKFVGNPVGGDMSTDAFQISNGIYAGGTYPGGRDVFTMSADSGAAQVPLYKFPFLTTNWGASTKTFLKSGACNLTFRFSSAVIDPAIEDFFIWAWIVVRDDICPLPRSDGNYCGWYYINNGLGVFCRGTTTGQTGGAGYEGKAIWPVPRITTAPIKFIENKPYTLWIKAGRVMLDTASGGRTDLVPWTQNGSPSGTALDTGMLSVAVNAFRGVW